MIRMQVISIVDGGVTLKHPSEEKPRKKVYQYPKGIEPALTDKVYVDRVGQSEIIVTVHGGV